MKLRNKKTGEIVEYDIIEAGLKVNPVGGYIAADSLTEFCDEWEDVEEPKEYWTIDCGMAIKYTWSGGKYDRAAEAVGLKFDTKEECDRAIEKLKAFKRLKDKWFMFDGYDVADRVGDDVICGQVYFKAGNYDKEEIENDLYLLFSQEDD